jgi:glycosyltransferase involved in cell wall biosynthesis
VPVLWHCRIAQSDPYLDPLLARLSTRIATNSQATADRFSPRFQAKTSVVYNGVDIEWLQHRRVLKPSLIQDEWKIILTVARVSKWKRHDLVLSAFEQVAKSDPMLHLVCLGSTDELEPDWWAYLQERTRLSPFSERVHWIGHVDDVRPWYRAAYTLVLASEREPFGRVIVEAMACGVPVIATRAGGVPEIIRHQQDGLLVAPDSVEELIEAIKKILQDKFLRERLFKSAQLRAESFSLERHMMNMIQVFEKTITNCQISHLSKDAPPKNTG